MTGKIELDCNACKSKASMTAAKTPKFNTILRIIGVIIVIPSVLGIVIAVMMLFATGAATTEVMASVENDAQATGAAIGATVGIGFSLFIGFSSLVGGIIGWLLLMKKKVFKCVTCGFILDRA